MNVLCDYFFEYETKDELRRFLRSGFLEGKKFLNVGCGSNLLFLRDFSGVVLHSAIKGIALERETDTEIFLRAGAGEVWDDVVRHAVARGWGGVENLSIIPGTVGASVVQNIGAYGVEAKDVVEQVETLDIRTGDERTFANADCRFAYRKSVFKTELKDRYVVTSVLYRLAKTPRYNVSYGNLSERLAGKTLSLAAVRDVVSAVRREKLPDPEVQGNAGSFFMNPVVPKSVLLDIRRTFPQVPSYELPGEKVKIPAAWLIEACGWKQRPAERVAVSATQPLVLVNRGGASPDDVVHFSQEIIRSVYEKFRIRIEPEVIFVE